MRVLVIYDSAYGNTQRVAEAIGDAIGGDAQVLRASQMNPARVDKIDLIAVGSPTQAGRPTKPIQDFIKGLSEDTLRGVKVASFDTRYAGRFVKVFGFAADRIAEGLTAKGGTLVRPPEPFIVTGKKGPLKDGELEHAREWAQLISK